MLGGRDYSGGVMNNKSPILPIGKVNLKTAANDMFGTLWECWEKDRGYNVVLKGVDFRNEGKLKVVHSSGSIEGGIADHPVGKVIEFCHDQDRYSMGRWTVMSVHAHSEAGLNAMAALTGKTSLGFSTYK